MKKLIIWALFALLTVAGYGQIEIYNGDDDVGAEVTHRGGAAPAAPGDIYIPTFLQGKIEALKVSSLAALTSPNVGKSRANAMRALLGDPSVLADRSTNPAAWHEVLPFELQSFDFVTTSFGSWMGVTTNPFAASEHGHRIVVSAYGRSPVSQYDCGISSGIDQIGEPVLFKIGFNSATGAELAFNPQFVGIDLGPDGILQSGISRTTGEWIAQGDDHIYQSGLPSATKYDIFLRLGATVAVNINGPSEFASLDFGPGSFITATLQVGGAVKATKTVKAPVPPPPGTPKLTIIRVETGVKVTVSDGADGVNYRLLTSASLSGPWVATEGTVKKGENRPFTVAAGTKFFRLVTP